jgi:hypothetical protein
MPDTLSSTTDSDQLSASDSPNNSQIRAALVQQVRRVFSLRDFDNLTVKRIRLAVEKKLGLDAGFLKNHVAWKDPSKDIIEKEAV